MILDYKAIGSRIREVRKSKNMTQEKLSEAINVGYKHLSNIECGNGGVSIEVLASICSVLDISLDYIIFNKPDIRDVKMADDIYKEISSSIVCTAFSFLHYSEKNFWLVPVRAGSTAGLG